jgi:PAS domain S-box-containing protein
VVPVVGIGVANRQWSGLAEFLRALPSETGMAYVVVHEGATVPWETLTGCTAMPCTKVQDGFVLKPDQLYLASSKTPVTIRKNELRSRRVESTQRATPFDHFFVSLAEERGEAAIGIVFDGTSRIGEAGLEEIRNKGGFAFVQGEGAQPTIGTGLYGGRLKGIARAIERMLERDSPTNNNHTAVPRIRVDDRGKSVELPLPNKRSLEEIEDLEGVFQGLSIPLAIVDREGRIRRINPAAATLLNVSDDVAGQRISALRMALDLPDLLPIVEGAVDSLLPRECEVVGGNRRYLLRVRPYKGLDNRGSGAILEFLEIGFAREKTPECSDGLVRALLKTARQAILVVNTEGEIILANPAAETMFGVSQSGLIGRQMEEYLADAHGKVLATERTRFRDAGNARSSAIEVQGRRPDGFEFPMEITIGTVSEGDPAVLVYSVSDMSEQAAAKSALRKSTSALDLKEQELLTLTASLLTSQETERRTISRDLQEDLNQKLAVLAVDVDALSQSCTGGRTPGDLRTQMEMLRGQVNDVSDRLRRIAYQLHPSVLDHLGLGVGIRSLCEDYGAKGMTIRFRYGGLPEVIPGEVALCVYRVIQESLSRIAALGQEQSAAVLLAGASDEIAVTVTSPAPFASPRHLGEVGLLSIIERVRLLNGSVAAHPRHRGGSRIVIRIPLIGGTS